MRVLLAIAFLVLGATAAGAADVSGAYAGRGRFIAHYDPVGSPAAQILLYDWEPPPSCACKSRHYFPFGRDRVRRAHWVRPRPAPDFYRSWSTSSDFDPPPPYWAPPLPPPRPPVVDK